MRTWLVLLLLVPLSAADGLHEEPDAEAWIQQWLLTREVSTPETARITVEEQNYPLPADPMNRFEDFIHQETLASMPELNELQRWMRFAHITDLQLVDDDVPPPMRVDLLDPVFALTIDGGGERPQEEYADEIFHALLDVLAVHHDQDALEFAVHTGDNIDNALENELVRYLDLIAGTHTTTTPLTNSNCLPDGQSTGVDDRANDVIDACTSIPEHLVAELRGLGDVPWYSLNGNHDALIQGNVVPQPEFNLVAEALGRHFLMGNEYVSMHFTDLDICAGGSEADDWGHGYGFADEARRCDDDVENDAYYAFTHNGVRMIVLDTVNDEVYQTNENGQQIPTQSSTGRDVESGLSQGAIDAQQFAWLQEELANSADTPTIVYGHHTPASFYSKRLDPLCAPVGCLNDVLRAAGFIGREDMHEELAKHPQLMAYIGGHTHAHDVRQQDQYWVIETSGLLDLPQESRIIELWGTQDKVGIALDPIGHTFQLAKDLAATDPDVDPEEGVGEPDDRRTMLWWSIPEGVQVPSAGPQPPGRGDDADNATATVRWILMDALVAPEISIELEILVAGAVLDDNVTIFGALDDQAPIALETDLTGTYWWNGTVEIPGTHRLTLTSSVPLMPDSLEFDVAEAGPLEKESPFLAPILLFAALLLLARRG